MVYEVKMFEDVTRDVFMMMDDVVYDGLAFMVFCGDNCVMFVLSVFLDEFYYIYYELVSEIVGLVDEILFNNIVRKLLLMGSSKESIDGVRLIWEVVFRG